MTDRNEPKVGLINLVKGDPNNLVGDVIVYASVNGVPTVNDDPADQNEFSEDDLAALLERIEISLVPEESEEQDVMKGYYNEEVKASEIDFDVGVDVIDLGDFVDRRKARIATAGITLLYNVLYLNQLESKDSITSGSYQDLARRGALEAKLTWNYIDPIVVNHGKGDVSARNEALVEFITFCEASPLEDISLDLAKLLLVGKPNEELQDLYLKKIYAVASGQDERTKYIDRMIKKALPATSIDSKFPVPVRKKYLREQGLGI